MPSRGKILVIRGGAIGDFILTLPVFSALRQQFPEAHLEVLGYPHIANLALAGKLVEQVRSIEARPLAGFFARGGNLSEELREYFSSFDIIISYLYDPDKIFQTNVALHSKAQFIAGSHRPDENLKLHATKVFLQPLERLAIFDADPIPKFSLDSQPTTLNSLALHPGSGSERKNWPETKWSSLIAQILEKTSFNLLLIGGEAEGARLKRLSANLPDERVKLAENLSLVDLAARLESSAAFIGHDSGISHLAAALNLPGLILWGETIAEIWRPPNSRFKIIRHPEGLARLSVKQVIQEVKNLSAEKRLTRL
ncbi:MAG: glycosyltransferase family 9 protein [Verrucomicrobiota bacterium]